MPNVLDFVEPGSLLSDEVVKPPIFSKDTVQEPSWAALGICDINLGPCRGLVLIDDKVLDPVSLAKQIKTNIGWFGLERQ